MTRFYARHGKIQVEIVEGQMLSRKEAVELALELARAIQMADDIGDPFAVELVELLSKKVKEGQ